VDFEPSDDQAALQEELRRFLTSRVTSEARRAVAEVPGAVDRSLWGELGEMGVFGLRLPESAEGGVGLGLAEAVIVFEELGRVVAPGPLVATHIAAGLVDGAATGAAVVGLLPAGPGPVLVEHLDALDVLLVIGDDGDDGVDRVDPAALRGSGTGAGREPLERPLDPLTPVHLLDALPSGERIADAAAAERLRIEGALLSAAMQVGLGQAAIELGTAYAKERTQFDRPIGSFQAVKHLLANAQVAVEIARAGVQSAAVVSDEALDAEAIHGARIVASRAAQRATTTCIQVHGGMGYTWELDAHLFFKRALVLDQTPGTTEHSYDALAAAL
jgi:alkylation response protein AidB-like acyl-CoA dehydrogenase